MARETNVSLKIKSVEKEFEDLKKINIKAKKHIINNSKNGFGSFVIISIFFILSERLIKVLINFLICRFSKPEILIFFIDPILS